MDHLSAITLNLPMMVKLIAFKNVLRYIRHVTTTVVLGEKVNVMLKFLSEVTPEDILDGSLMLIFVFGWGTLIRVFFF